MLGPEARTACGNTAGLELQGPRDDWEPWLGIPETEGRETFINPKDKAGGINVLE